MVLEWVPAILFGFLLIGIGIRLNGDAPIFGLTKIGLIIAGLILVGWGGFAGWAELTSGL